jgi:sortase A
MGRRLTLPFLDGASGRGRALVLAGCALFVLAGGIAAYPKPAPPKPNPYAKYGYGPDGLPMAGVPVQPIPSPDATAQAKINVTRASTTVDLPTGTSAIAWISIPAINIHDVPIFDRGLDSRRRMQIASGFAVTHYAQSARLGGASNAVLYGHDDIEGGVFGHLKQLSPGDSISVRLADGTVLNYLVRTQQLVLPSAISILAPTRTPTLTLFSCYPLWVDDQRVVITATPA